MTVVAIDGPSGSGKSTVARALAARLGLGYLDTGAMYRWVTLEALRRGLDLSDGDLIAKVAQDADLDGDAPAEIRGPEVTANVSTVSAHPGVRREMVRRQRAWIEAHGGGVVEGRDIGTEVWPEAELKVFLTADLDVRAQRRGAETGTAADPADLARRDQLDSSRAASPLRRADGAVVVDTTDLSIDEIVDGLLSCLT